MHCIHLPGRGDLLHCLRSAASALDACWWYLGGTGFSLTPRVRRRLQYRAAAHGTDVEEAWLALLREHVDQATADYRIGRPGFFRALAACADFYRCVYFAVEGAPLPLDVLNQVARHDAAFYSPLPSVPPQVIFAARDIDSGAYAEFFFRDQPVCQWVLEDLKNDGTRAFKVARWDSAKRPSP